MKQIPLTQGKFALVDDADYPALMLHSWRLLTQEHTCYAIRPRYQEDGKRTTLQMHRVVLNAKAGFEVDHRDGNGLNNQRYNLRKCTKTQNQQNRKPNKNTFTGYKGVHWNKGNKQFVARIRVNGERVELGRFFCVVKAAKAYDSAAKEHFGEFARTNF